MAAVAAQGGAPGRLRQVLAVCTLAVATAAGWTTGRLLAGWAARRTVPGLAGAAMVAYGAAMIYTPAGVIAGGVFLLLMDRRL